ncbi:hypothetical protein GLAREA_08750 [Glarea lozoyensis ATCC 20868]|uniref:Ubiquitin-conjugating enzyme E2C-binding protein n=1 Tax=Glarea lozoyensis (strain ATCC 20868 / MF5171) TaxID=1116229 RepID=S3DDS5_GLAL2|nr:uncharacterized protein GLAREA_08750 [Glarea lozoyensis ATCC 20868]EPE36587.1 hypothetical protein GLAREA_08750 [Glarea lozoyensis ATCC 20868]
MAGVKPLIYAELLSNIRQVSVIAALNTPSDSSTRVEVLDGGRQILVSHQDLSSVLILPGQVTLYSQLQQPVSGQKEVSWRLPLASAPSSGRVVANLQENETPWSARDLGEDAEFSCRECSAIIIKNGSIKDWKDLPSENWAEMMEFWHCHKPDVPKHEQNGPNNGSSDHKHHSHTDSNANRGYGANSKFIARKSTGFVDPTTFLLASADCSNIQGLQKSELSNKQLDYQPLSCLGCNQYLGIVDPQAEGVRLYKWRLLCNSRPSSQPNGSTTGSILEAPSLSVFFASELIRMHLSQCVSRILLSPISWKPAQVSTTPTKTSFPKFISLWVLSPGLKVSGLGASPDSPVNSSNDLNSTTQSLLRSLQLNPKRPGSSKGNSTSKSSQIACGLKVKLFWNHVDEKAAIELQDREDTEELSLPVEAIEELSACLQNSANILPPSARRFQTWNVGLLDRYEQPR